MNVGDYNNPLLRPETAAIVKKDGAHGARRRRCSQSVQPLRVDAAALRPARARYGSFWQSKDHVTPIYGQDSQFRRVRLNGVHPTHIAPTALGDSIGHYEGDTLVVDTVGIAVGPTSVIDLYGTPHSDVIHVIERYRLIDGKAAKDVRWTATSANMDGPPPRPRMWMKAMPAGIAGAVHRRGRKDLQSAVWTSSVTYRRSTGHWEEVI